MNSTSKFVLVIFFSLPTLFFGCKSEGTPPGDAASELTSSGLFRLLTPEKTNVGFVNQLDEGLNTNILMYEYFYNGGGVVAGDFNGDNHIDLYFTSNMGENKMYLNQGENSIQFREVTPATGAAGRPGPWKTGVNAVDINGDGKLDIYLCYSGAMPEEKRKNQLFINLGNDENNIPRFEDQAEQYGLASNAFSNQAYFFDYDRDGDLDMILLNHNPKNLPVLNEIQTAELMKTDDPQRGVRLFNQKNGKFSDVTTVSGISSSSLTYGLGIGISDFNGDGWPDFYVSNDYAVPDYLYLNNKNGTFSNVLETAIGHTSQFSMGNDVADFNNDGQTDIFTLDMLPEDNARQKLLLAPDNYGKFDLNFRSGFYYQYMRNMLQLNNGNGTFSEIGQLAGISNTDWSWAALAADFDNDGWKDLYITNGYNKDYTNLDFINYMDNFVKQKGRLVREDVLEIISNMPASNVPNYMYRNNGSLSFTNVSNAWGLGQTANSNGAVYADLDNDGDLDLVVNNINKPAFIYENQASGNTDRHYLKIQLQGEGMNTHAIGARVLVYCGSRTFTLEQFPARGYLSAVSTVLHFGLGKVEGVDSLEVFWPAGKYQKLSKLPSDTLLTLYENQAEQNPPRKTEPPKSIFTSIKPVIPYTNPVLSRRDFDRQKLLTAELSFSSPCMAKADVNGDGLEDLFIGGASGQAGSLFIQKEKGNFSLMKNPAFEEDRMSEDTDAVFFDANGDGYLDLYVASGGYHQFEPNDPLLQDRLYLNDGKGNFTKAPNALPELNTSTGCIAVSDINLDGHPDIFAGSRVVPGRYPEAPESYILINDGSGKFADQTKNVAPELAKFGMICDASWADLNQDGYEDLVIVGEWLPVSVFINKNGQLENQTANFFEKPYSGFWNKIEIADLNHDQRPDFIVGNLGVNTQLKASDEQPAELFFADFDGNGSIDPILSTYIMGESYPYLTRDELLAQLVSFRRRFTTYESFSNVKTRELFPGNEFEKADYLKANHLATSLFLSTATGKFELKALPVEAQFAPVHAIHILDFNKDGNPDVLLAGNNSRMKLRLGKADANYGMLFQNDGTGRLRYIDQNESGLKLRGDVRSILQFDQLLLFGMNQQPLESYKLN